MRHTYAKITFQIILMSFLAFLITGCGGEDSAPGEGAALISLASAVTELPADGASATSVVAVVTNSNGTAVTERTSVTFRTTLGTFRNGKKEYKAETVATGTVSVQLVTGTVTGNAEVTAECNGFQQKIEISFYDPHKIGSIVLSAGNASIMADGVSQVAVIATVNDADGNPEPGITVSFNTTLGHFDVANPIDPSIKYKNTTAITDVDGEAKVMLISGQAIGTANILGSVDGRTASTSVIFTGGAAATLTLRAAPSTVKPDGSSDIIATLSDINNNPISGQTIVFSSQINASEGSLNSLSASTNINGEAKVSYTAGKLAGADVIQARLSSDAGMNSTTTVVVDPEAIVIGGIIVTAGSSSLVADGVSKVKIRAVVTDIDGKPAIGKKVNFSSTAGVLESTEEPTSDIGLAEVMLLSSTFAGPVTVEAECDGFIGQAQIEFIPGPADHILLYAFPNVVPPNGAFQTACIVMDKYNNRIDDQRITFLVREAGDIEKKVIDSAEMTPDQAEDGVYRFDWAAVYGENDLEITARVNNGVEETVTVDVDQDAIIVGSINVIAGAAYIKADGVSSTTIRATVLDNNNQPAQGITVNFSATLGSLIPAKETTDQNGIAEVTLRSGTVWGTATVTGDANGFQGQAKVLFTSGVPGGVSLTAVPSTVLPGEQSTIIAELNNGSGAPVPGEILYFDLYDNNTNSTLDSIQEITDVNGRAMVIYTAGVTQGTDRIRVRSASDSRITDTDSVRVQIPSGRVGYITLTSGASTIPNDGSSTSVTATIFDTTGSPMPEGTSITFTTTLGKFPGGGLTQSLSTADDSGIVITSLISEGTGGVAEINANSGGVEQTIYVIIDDGSVDVGEILLTSADSSLPADGSSSTAITVLIKDSSGNPVPSGTAVVLTTDHGSFEFGTVKQSIALATVGTTGTVITPLIADDEPGIATITATAGSKSQSITVSMGVVGGVTVTAGAVSLPADGSSETLIRATVRDTDGNLAPGVDVLLATTLGTFEGTTNPVTVTTNAAGVAEVMLVSSTTTGTATVTATANGFVDSVDVAFVSGAPGGLVLTATSLIVNPGEQSTLTATLTDSGGSPIVGETIAFSFGTNSSNASLSALSAVTNINGQVSITYTAGANNGDDTVWARSVADAGKNDSVAIVVGGQVTLEASDDPIYANGTSTSIFTATVLNNAGDPVQDVLVVFKDITDADLTEVQAGTFNGTGPSDTSVFTHGGGAMTFTMSHKGTSNFAVWLRDKDGNIVELVKNMIGSITNQISQEQVPAGEYYLDIAFADGNWTILVESEVGGEIAGSLDEFDALPTLAVQNTDGAGQATYTYTSTTIAKTVTIGIKAGKVLADASIEQVAGAVDSLELYAAPDTVNPLSNATLTAIVKDSNGNPVFGETVNFAFGTNNSGGSMSSASAKSTLSGEASVTYTAGSINSVTDTLRATIVSPALSVATTIDVDASAVMIGSVTIAQGSATLPADGASQTFIRATVRDTDENEVPGIAVEFTVSMPGAAIITPITTNGDGVAQTMLTSSTHSGTCTVTAIAGGFHVSTDVVFFAGVPRTVTLNAAPATVHPSGTSTVTATLEDSHGNPVPGETIVFAIVTNNSGGILSAPSAVTNINGQATITYTGGTTVPVLPATNLTDTIHAISVTDTDVDADKDIIVDASATIVGSVTLVSGASSLPADGTSTTLMRATVRDTDGNLAPGINVVFVTTYGTLNNVTTPVTVMTNANGTADVTLKSTFTSGTATVTANASGFVDSKDVIFASADPLILTLIAEPSIVGTEETSTLTATLFDADGNRLADETIAFVFGTNNSGASLSAPSAVTNINGQATITYTAGPNSGDDTIEARSITETSVNASITIVAGPQVSLVASPISILADGITTSTFTATVLNNSGDPMVGVPVIFKNITAASLPFDDLPTLATITTTAPNGEAAYTYPGSTIAGEVTIGVKVGTVFADTSILLTAGPPADPLVVSASPDTTLPGLDVVVTAKVTDVNDNPIGGVTVNFSITTINSGTPSLSAASAVTNLSGEATVDYTAGFTEGTDTITASSAGLTNATVDIDVDANAIVVGSMLLAVSQSSLPADGSSSSAVTATVVDTEGQPIPAGTPVRFTTTLGTFPGGTDPDGVGPLTSQLTLNIISGGKVLTSLIAPLSTTGTATITAYSGAVSQTITVTIRGEDIPEAQFLSLSTTKTSIETNGTDSATITATVLDASHVPISGTTVNFVSTGGQISASDVTTDANGQASIILTSGPDKANQTVTITAEVDAQTALIPINLYGTEISVAPSTAQVSVGSNQAVTVKAVDAGNNPIYDAEITISFNAGTSSSTLLPPAGTYYTDYAGEIALVLSAVAPAGTAVINAAGLGTSASGTYEIGDPANLFYIKVPASSPVSEPADGTLVNVTLHAGGMSAGQTVVFVTSLGTWSGYPGSSAEYTITPADVAGTLDITLQLSHTEAGLATVQVYKQAVPSAVDFTQISFFNPASKAYSIVLDASQTNILASTGTSEYSLVINAKVYDIDGDPVQDAVVDFSMSNTTGSGESISPVSAITDTAGNAQTTFTSGTLGTGSDPSSAILVTARVTTPATCTNETTTVQCVDEGTTLAGGDYFTLSQTGADYYVWYDVDDGSVDPAPGGLTGIEVDITSGELANAVAAATQVALDAVAGFTATAVTDTVTVDTCGDVTDVADGVAATGFTIATTLQGTGNGPNWRSDDVSIVVSGAVANISIGYSTVISSAGDDTLYEQPISVLVADTNGNPVPGTLVSLSLRPTLFYTGYWWLSPIGGWVVVKDNPCDGTPFDGTHTTPFEFINEDLNGNAILDVVDGEDELDRYSLPYSDLPPYFYDGDGYTTGWEVPGLNDGQLTPGQSVAGTIPSSVVTDDDGVAIFTLTFQKEYSVWVEDQIVATAMVFGTEYITKSRRVLPLMTSEKTVIANAFPESPFNVLTCGTVP